MAKAGKPRFVPLKSCNAGLAMITNGADSREVLCLNDFYNAIEYGNAMHFLMDCSGFCAEQHLLFCMVRSL
jgi:hypothetical protein